MDDEFKEMLNHWMVGIDNRITFVQILITSLGRRYVGDEAMREVIDRAMEQFPENRREGIYRSKADGHIPE
jgi:hypothetical protein